MALFDRANRRRVDREIERIVRLKLMTEPRGQAYTARDSGIDYPGSNILSYYQPLAFNLEVYRAIRELVPFCNIAIKKLIAMLGGFQIDCGGDEKTQTLVDDFVKNVRHGWFGSGMANWVGEVADSTYEAGHGVSEIVLTEDAKAIWGLIIADPETISFKKIDGVMRVCVKKDTLADPEPVPDTDLVNVTMFDTRKGQDQGYSIFYSAVVNAQAYMRWIKAFDNQLFRFGSMPMHIHVKGGATQKDATLLKIVDEIKTELAAVFVAQKKGQSKDLITYGPGDGDIQSKALGDGNKMIEIEFELKTVLEAIMADTGLSPYQLGVSWYTTETMSKMQADTQATMIRSQRGRLEAIIRRAVETHLVLNKRFGQDAFEIAWDPILMLDEVEMAKARLYNAQANASIMASIVQALTLNLMDQPAAEEYLRNEGIVPKSYAFPRGWGAKAQDGLFLKAMIRNMKQIGFQE